MCTHQWLTELLRKVNCALLQKCTHPFRFVPFKPKKISFRGGCMRWFLGNFGHVLLGKSRRFFRILWSPHNIWSLLALFSISSDILVVLSKVYPNVLFCALFKNSILQFYYSTVNYNIVFSKNFKLYLYLHESQ